MKKCLWELDLPVLNLNCGGSNPGLSTMVREKQNLRAYIHISYVAEKEAVSFLLCFPDSPPLEGNNIYSIFNESNMPYFPITAFARWRRR